MPILLADCVTQNTQFSPDTFVDSPVNYVSLAMPSHILKPWLNASCKTLCSFDH